MRQRLTSDKAMPIVSWAGLLISVPGLLALVVVSIVEKEWAALGSVAVGLSIVLTVIRLLWRRHRPAKLEETTVFRPFDHLSPSQVWPRKDVDRILAAIKDPCAFIPLVVGASGVGKSTLLNVMVRERIRTDFPDIRYTVISARYSGIVDRLNELIAECRADRPGVIVLDQFEQWLAFIRPRSYEDRTKQQELLHETLTRAQGTDGCTVMISLRREWYFELSFLKELVPSPDDACEIQAPSHREQDSMWAGIRRSFIEVIGDDDEELADELMDLLSPTGRLLPLKAQIVGAVLERRQEAGDDIDLEYFKKEMGGVRGVVDMYFREVLEGAEQPELCMKILFALSVKSRFRIKARLSMLIDSLYEEADAIRDALAYLVRHRLVAKHGTANYALAHDFLAEFFSAKSGLELPPVDRDNIQIYAAEYGEHSPAVNSRKRSETRRRRPFGMILVAVLMVLMVARFLYFGFDTDFVDAEIAKPLVGQMFDATYLLILLPYAAWICYIGLFYDRLLVHLRESRAERFFSRFIMFSLVVSVVLGIVMPFAWLLGIALSGLLFVARVFWLSSSTEISRSARKRLREYAMPTLMNLLFVGVMGVIGLVLSIKYVKTEHDVNTWIWINLIATVMMTYWCIALAPHHVSRKGIAQFLGLIGRPGTVAYASFDD